MTDHTGLDTAVHRQVPVIPVYVHDEEADAPWPAGAASRWWLHHSLTSLAQTLADYGSRLIIARGPTQKVLSRIARETGAVSLSCQKRYEPANRALELAVETALASEGVRFEPHPGGLLFEPDQIRNQQGRPFQVFTPYWKAARQQPAPTLPVPAPAPGSIVSPRSWPDSLDVSDLKLLPTISWDTGFHEAWQPGEAGARQALANFERRIAEYDTERNRPDHPGTSRLSPHLHFGEISPRTVWQSLQGLRKKLTSGHDSIAVFESELGWREFTHHQLFHFPQTTSQPLREAFNRFPWRDNPKALKAWQRGRTGYPIVDAGMRELWTTGWMHNRVRMIVGSFLTKDLMLPWQTGADWFWDTLVDADLAQNTFNWQWVAGCGADAAPYFRIFNPVLQGQKFDPNGDYVRTWVPELANLPAKWIHEPWKTPASVQTMTGFKPGLDYPRPIVDHSEARDEALAAYATLKDNPG